MKNPVLTIIFVVAVAIVVIVTWPPPTMKEVVAGAIVLAIMAYLFDKYVWPRDAR